MGAKSARNLIIAIQESKTITLQRFLFALGIRHVGEHIAEILASNFKSLETIMATEVDTFRSIDGVGETVAESLRLFFASEENKKTILALIESGVQITADLSNAGNELAGITFVLTGTLENLKRVEAKKIITKAGGRVTGSVSRNTGYLVAGAFPGSKVKKALELNVPVITESELINLVKKGLPG